MARLVRLFKGRWSRNQQGVWTFIQDLTVGLHDVLLRVNESIDGLMDLVRCVFGKGTGTPVLVTFKLPPWMAGPDEDTIPPKNVDINVDVEIVMGAHQWNTEPKLCVIIGAEDVARYQFICRSTFTVGDRTFLSEGVTEEQHMATINGTRIHLFGYSYNDIKY